MILGFTAVQMSMLVSWVDTGSIFVRKVGTYLQVKRLYNTEYQYR